MAVENKNLGSRVQCYPQYEIHFLDVGDADCIAIRYQKDALSRSYVALVDAGNVSDAPMIKRFFAQQFRTCYIDLAVCTHPDSDHKGGFFGLLEDSDVSIREFWLKAPVQYITDAEFSKMWRRDSIQDACNRVYNHPTDPSKNLIELATSKKNKDGSLCRCCNVKIGASFGGIPLVVVGPEEKYYHEAAVGMVANFAELTCEPDTEEYDERDEVSEEKARSVIDEELDDSYTNMGSLILYFNPVPDMRMLLAGDASSASLRAVYDANENKLANCILKVPHHGSRHNLNTALIDDLKPAASIISAAGTKKHPNAAIVRYLSNYGDVYSTHKSHGLVYSNCLKTEPAMPLRKKQVLCRIPIN